MTQEQIQEGNKIIAEFMEIPKCSRCEHDCGAYHFSSGLYYRPDQMKYHSSWDWLMPVVIKLRNMVHETENFRKMGGMFMYVQEVLLQVDLELLYTEVVDFIKWYNQNKEL